MGKKYLGFEPIFTEGHYSLWADDLGFTLKGNDVPVRKYAIRRGAVEDARQDAINLLRKGGK